MNSAAARELFGSARVVRLATVGGDRRPHLVPMVFAVVGDVVYSAVDGKPKRSTDLRRIANITLNPYVCLLADHYDDSDWNALWWVRADGSARVLEIGGTEAGRGAELLRERYRQYGDVALLGPVVAVDVDQWSGWSAR